MHPARPTIEREGNLARSNPKRPLSAFNLFYRFKRQKVIDAVSLGKVDKDTICRLVEAAPGLEDYPPNATMDASPQVIDDLRRNNIRKDLEHNLLPRDTRDRTHRTNQMNGAMSFLELGKVMNTSWKNCDDFAKSVFNELSVEGREHYRLRLNEYNASGEGLLVEYAKASSTKKNKSTKKNSIGKASPDPSLKNDDISDDGITMKETAEAKWDCLRKHICNDANILTSVNNHAAAPSVLDLLAKKYFSNGGNQEMRMAMATATGRLHTVSAEYNACQEIEPPRGRPNNGTVANLNLMLRVQELEGQLAAERLLMMMRVRELESDLARHKTVEDQLRAQLAVSISTQNGSTATIANTSSIRDGLWSLVSASASMLHPSLLASERAAMLSRMVATRHDSPLPHVMLRPHVQESEPTTTTNLRRMDANKDPPNKKQRRN